MDTPALPTVISPTEMVALYDALRTLHDVALGLCCQPRFKGPPGLYNPAGEILDDLATFIGMTSDEIASRMEAFRPDPTSENFSDDFASRSEVLIRHELNCNGITSAAALAQVLYGKPGEAP